MQEGGIGVPKIVGRKLKRMLVKGLRFVEAVGRKKLPPRAAGAWCKWAAYTTHRQIEISTHRACTKVSVSRSAKYGRDIHDNGFQAAKATLRKTRCLLAESPHYIVAGPP